jgi:DNA-binding NtrC family response regulator
VELGEDGMASFPLNPPAQLEKGGPMSNAGASVYVVDDDASVREAVESLIRSAGLKVETFASAREFLASSRADVPSCLLLDVELPGLSGLDLQRELAAADVQIPIIFLTGHGDIPMTVRAIKAGALEFLTKPVDDEDLLGAIRQGIASYHAPQQPCRNLAEHNFEPENLYLEGENRTAADFAGIVGQSSALRQVLQLVETVATTDSSVLLLGETGTGKELVARAIHDRSRRKERTFVKLNCAAIPSGLLESELFGHERGAFTGAITQKIGRLELADQGTLFLDEVGDIPLELQPKLLRVLQDGEFERLGSTRTKKVAVRLVAATNRDLDRMIEERQFRNDLYYRLNVFPIRVPPLRERPEDIPLLVRYFSQKFARRMEKRIESIPAAAMRKLTHWHWPGNVRELQNLVERAVVLSRSSSLAIPVLELANNGANLAPAIARSIDGQDWILRVLRETKGRVGGPHGAAARLGLKRTTLLTRMKKMGIDPRMIA